MKHISFDVREKGEFLPYVGEANMRCAEFLISSSAFREVYEATRTRSETFSRHFWAVPQL